MNDVTRILSAMKEGDPRAAAQLLPVVYEELRKLAARSGQPVDVLVNAGVTNQQQLRETAISRGLHWRIKALRDLLRMLK